VPDALFLHDATLLDGDTPRRADVLVVGGRIEQIAADLDAPADARRLDLGGAFVSPGWLDLYARLGEPGLEHRETVATGTAAGWAGGFTALVAAPETDPPLDTHDAVRFVQAQAAKAGAEVAVVGAFTKRRTGEELAELGDLADAGAVAFSDGRFVADAALMRRALEYAGMLDRPVLVYPHDPALAGRGLMHEGAAGTRAGLPGLPEVAETAALARDLLLAQYTGARIHVLHATTGASLDLIRRAKDAGVRVTASVSAAHLALTDAAVEGTAYRVATKLRPPLRPAADVEALRAALVDGTLDAVFSDHAPHARHETEVEFAAAPFGASALETTWAVLSTHLVGSGLLSVERAAALLWEGPRRCLDLPAPGLAEGAGATLTVFDTDTPWTLDAEHLRSRGKSTPFDGHAFTGRVRGVVVGGRWIPEIR
jgi:dihydroorotase